MSYEWQVLYYSIVIADGVVLLNKGWYAEDKKHLNEQMSFS